MNYCDFAAFDDKSKKACADWKRYPEHFIINNVLEAKPVSAIDSANQCVPPFVPPNSNSLQSEA
jgi:hypothetical protein